MAAFKSVSHQKNTPPKVWEQLQQSSWINASFHDDIDSNNPVWDLAYDRALATLAQSPLCPELEAGISAADAVAYDVAAAAVEIATDSKITFFRDLIYWYSLGHFPCGWQGEHPEGKLIVF